MTIEEVYNNKEISVRSYNVCRRNGIDSIVKLQQYYTIYQTFEKLHNCGRRSNEELIEIYFKYQDYIEDIDNTPKINKNHLEETLLNLTRIQRDVINSFIQVNTNSLSVRSKNAISIYLENNFSVRNFIEKILVNHSFKIEKIENIGKKSIPELEIYISIISDMITDVSQSNDEKQLISLKNTFLIQQKFSVSKIPSEILQSESIFGVVSFLINSSCLYSNRDTQILTDALYIFSGERESDLSKIAKKHNLTRQRVESIRKEGLYSLFEKLSFIKNFNDDLIQNYGIDLSSNLIDVKENLVNKINTLNKTNFSKEFTSYILAVYLSENFLVIGNIEDILQPKYFNNRTRHNWNNFYIVNKKLTKVDFISLANDVNERLNERIEETYSFNFKSYLSRFIKDLDIEVIELAFPVAEKIINDEFSIYLDLEDNIVFERKTNKNSFEYSYEALEQLGKPSKVEEITRKIYELYPNYETDEAKVRSSMKRNNGFVPVGRNSVFGLKKWENELDDFKGGTIRSISNEFLEQFDEPKHISEITKYVLKYRPNSNEKSIYYNLRIDESETFSFFKNSYIGLASRKYKINFEVLEESKSIVKKTWDERYDDLINFISINNNLPYYNSTDPREKTLFRWLNNQKHSKKLSEDQKKLISKILKSQ